MKKRIQRFKNYIVHDIETTGIYPEMGHEIVQLSMKAINGNNLSYFPGGQLTLLIKPQFPEKAEPKAIEVIGKELFEKANKEGLEPKVAFKRALEFISQYNGDGSNKWEKPWMVGHNYKFDFDFSNYWYKHYKLISSVDDAPYHFNFLDTLQMMHCLFNIDHPVNYRLDTLLEIFGDARGTENHDAEEDVNQTADKFIRFMKFFRECRRRMRINPKETEKEIV